MCGWQPTATICPDSSVGRAADSYPAGQWFDPTSWHHLLYFHFISFHRPEQVYQNCSLYRAGSAKVAYRSHKPKTRFESYARVHLYPKPKRRSRGKMRGRGPSRQGDSFNKNPWEWSAVDCKQRSELLATLTIIKASGLIHGFTLSTTTDAV